MPMHKSSHITMKTTIETLTIIRDHGKVNSVWAASKESKMADAALSSTPAPFIAEIDAELAKDGK